MRGARFVVMDYKLILFFSCLPLCLALGGCANNQASELELSRMRQQLYVTQTKINGLQSQLDELEAQLAVLMFQRGSEQNPGVPQNMHKLPIVPLEVTTSEDRNSQKIHIVEE